MSAKLSLTVTPSQLKFLLSSSAENLIRLESILKRRQLFGPSPEFDAIIAAMLDLCRRYREYYLHHAKIINRILADESTSQIEELAVRTLLRNCINTFLVLHELLLFLPREPIRKELYFFCEQLFSPCYDPKDLSVILTSVYNAFEYSLDAAIRSLDVYIMKVPDPRKLDFGHVMELAIIDRDNPLSWPVLAHEFGHFLDEKHQISGPLAEQFVDAELRPTSDERSALVDLFRRLAEELFADLTSYYLLGPVGILPVINMDLNFGMATDKPMPFDGIHPLTTTRLQDIADAASSDHMALDLFGTYVQALTEDENVKISRLTLEEKRERASLKKYTTFFADRLRTTLLNRIEAFGLSRFGKPNLAIAAELKESLSDGVPIGAKRQQADDDIKAKLQAC